VRTVGSYVSRGMPVLKLGGPGQPAVFDIAACRKWVDANINSLDTKPESNGELSEAIKREKLAKLEEEVRAKRLQNDILEGQLVYRELVERNAARFAVQIKTDLEAIPEQAEMIFPADKRREYADELDELIRSVLLRMSGWEAFDDA